MSMGKGGWVRSYEARSASRTILKHTPATDSLARSTDTDYSERPPTTEPLASFTRSATAS